jgi:prepilin-type processing-associated H-X9-DG protein
VLNAKRRELRAMKLRRKNQENRAFTMIEVLVVIVGVAAILFWLSLPSGPRAGAKAIQINCVNNLKQTGLAFRVWEGDNNGHFPMKGIANRLGVMELPNPTNVFRYFQVMSNELNNPLVLICPTDRRKPAKDLASLKNENLSYFVGLDADEASPAMPLAGDRNLVVDGVSVGAGLLTLGPTNQVGWSATMHKKAGNVLMADGSVQQVTSLALQSLIANSGTNVHRLAVP